MDGLELRELSAGYGKRPVVRGVSAAAEPGALLVLLGANGAGKSTVIKTIAGLLPPLEGGLYLGGAELSAMGAAERARRISVLLPDTVKPEQLRCREVVELGRYPYTGRFGLLRAEDTRIVEEVMERTGVTELAEAEYVSISDGQRQRVRLARCLAQEPELLLLDEPTVFLDVRYQAEFLALLRELAREKGMLVVLSMHEPELALCVADYLLCLKDGGVYFYGRAEEAAASGKLRGLYELDALRERLGAHPALVAYVERIGRR